MVHQTSSGREVLEGEECPSFAVVPLVLGTPRGKSLAMGAELERQASGPPGQGCFIGVEIVGSLHGEPMSMHLCFDPVCGKCFKTYHEDGLTVTAQALPALEIVPEVSRGGHTEAWVTAARSASCFCRRRRPMAVREQRGGRVEAWVRVAASGGICFCRRFLPAGQLEESGEISPESLPAWASTYFPTAGFQAGRLRGVAQISIIRVDDALPRFAKHVPSFVSKMAWSMYSL